MTPPARTLLRYSAAVIGNFASRMNGEMISQTPASALADCRLGRPRPATAYTARAATARPAIRSLTVALPP